MKTYDIIDAQGVVIARRVCSDEDIKQNTPNGCRAIESSGVQDDLGSGRAITEQELLDIAHAGAIAEITRLELAQLRPMRELALDPNNTEAIQRLDAIETRIAELRAKLKR